MYLGSLFGKFEFRKSQKNWVHKSQIRSVALWKFSKSNKFFKSANLRFADRPHLRILSFML
jgi:hypothetical protein